ncbi:hypothetical protein L210DRAFT_3611408 [Boletus edulis BED1]|uniref:Telomere-associated protein Rif1 N-terminal domain-containing protein n=1 Tax=Boletus edulis BED1 TaxID=1328754 RepID=A0AAD4GGN1_BOLED|nr:hypothetical protein L210DRAFT_3611408 [Boletus edulis BED1]
MSLPTPPATSHHRDKEIRLPGSRVAWAQQNQYYILSHTSTLSLPFRSCLERPARSILKKRDHPFLLPPEDDQREITPEPEDPLVDLTYLSRPVQQIISPDPTLCDLIEAYSILHARLRVAVASTTDVDASWPLFQPLRKNTHVFTQAVCRDLGRALIQPKLDLAPEDDVPMECEEVCEDDEACSLLPSPKRSPRKKKQGMSASQIKFARDLCTTTHAVLRLLSAIFTLQPLYQIFDDVQLRDILTHVLAIPMADELPTPNARKTCALSIWLLQVQRLPETVLLPARDRIAFALRRGMEGELGKEGKKGSACDGLKAVHDLSLHQPNTFVPAFVELLPSILANLLAPTLGLRTQACHALGGFVLGCVSLPLSAVHVRISSIVSTFLTTPSSSSSPRRSPGKSMAEPSIVRTLRMTLNTVDPQHVAQGPVWALSVLASLIVLLGPSVCAEVRLLRIVSALLTLAMRNKKSSVRALASLLWRCLAWAYLRPPLEFYPEGGEHHEEVGEEQDTRAAQESSWKLVKSVVDMGTGVSTVAALLGDDSDDEDRLRKALQLVRVMLGKGGQTTLDAIDIAKGLVNDENNGKSWPIHNLLPHSLFSSYPGLLTAEYKTLSTAVKPIFDECPQLNDIRPLTRDQLSRDWVFNELIEIWRATLGCLEIPDNRSLPSETLATWSGLMKSNVTLLLDADDQDGVIEFAAKSASILTEILRDSQLDLASTACPTSSKMGSHSKATKSMPVRSNSAMKLGVVRELWACMRTTFPNSLLHAGGTKLLECLVEDECDLVWETDAPDTARKEWAKLCSETLAICDVEELEKFWAKRSRSYAIMTFEPGVRSLVWGCFVETWTADREASWEGAIILLGVPFDNRSAWELSNDEFAVWDGFLKHTMNKVNDNGTDSVVVLDHVASVVARSPCPPFASSTRVADLLLSHCEMDDIRELPSNVFELVNDTLLLTYPPDPHNLKPSMWLIASLTRAIDTCPVEFRLNLLKVTQDGVCAWLSDEYRVFTRDEYALDVLPLYQTALLGIQELPRTLKVLEALSPLLQSVFIGRDDKSRVAREAFTEFWTTTFGTMNEPEGGWPEDLQICLLPPEEDHSEDDAEPSSDPEELEDVTVRAPSTAASELDDLSQTSLLSPRCDSLSNVQTPQASEKRTPSPFIGHLGPALFSPFEPSTPITGSRSYRVSTPPRPHKPISTPESFQSLVLKPPAGTLPVYPTTPTTPRTGCNVRPNLSPGKVRGLRDKENVSPLHGLPVLEGMYSTPIKSKPSSILGKRQMNDESPRESATKKGRTSFIRSSIEFPSAGDSDLEDELVVEAALTSPARKAQAHYERLPTPDEPSPTCTNTRKRKRQRIVMEAVVVPSLADVQRRERARRASTECVSPATASPSLRRSSSMPKLHEEFHSDEMMSLRRKRLRLWDDVAMSSSVLEETVIAGSDDSIILTGDGSKLVEPEGSDDDPHLGQVSPRHLASPAPRRHMNPDYSDDAPSSSPSRDLVARRQQRFGLVRTVSR